MSLMDTVRVVMLKKKARALLQQIREQEDHQYHGGGYFQPLYFGSNIHHLKNEFNATLDALAALDPNTPKGRL